MAGGQLTLPIQLVSSSDINFNGKVVFTPHSPLDSVNPQAMTIEDIKNAMPKQLDLQLQRALMVSSFLVQMAT